MMNPMEARMVEPVDERGGARSLWWMMVAGVGIVMTSGAIAGFMGKHEAGSSGEFSGTAIVVLGSFAAIIIGLTLTIWRNAQKMKVNGVAMSRREKLNRNIIVACGLLGGIIGGVLAASGLLGSPDDAPFDTNSTLINGPIPVSITLVLAFVWGVIIPVIAWFWHTRAIDEQEASAYRDGGYYAAYAFLILVPLWWLLWRGGLLPEPNGFAIYLTFSFFWSVVWFWKKYR